MQSTEQRLLFTVFTIAILSAGCGGGEYREEKRLIESHNAIVDRFSEKMEKAGSSPEMLAAIGEFIERIGPLVPKVRALKKSHPEWEHEPPKELEKTIAEYRASMTGLAEAANRYYEWYMRYPHDYQLERAYNLLRKLISDM